MPDRQAPYRRLHGRSFAARCGRRMVVATASLLLVACSAMARGPFQGLEDRIVDVAEQVTPTVVHIKAIVKFNDRRNQVTGSSTSSTTRRRSR
jgi:hypothetical protein